MISSFAMKDLYVMLNEKWQKLIEVADFAFQPIVNIYTGKLYAVEALIRNYEAAGFTTIDCIFDTAYSEKTLYLLDVKLREKAIHKFSLLPFSKHIKLFYNLDNRITMMPDFKSFFIDFSIFLNFNIYIPNSLF